MTKGLTNEATAMMNKAKADKDAYVAPPPPPVVMVSQPSGWLTSSTPHSPPVLEDEAERERMAQARAAMFSFLNPWFIIGAISPFIGVYFYGHHAGYQERVDEDQAEIIRLNGEARAKEAELNKK